MARLWEEEELDRGETIDRARLLVLFSEEMELGELAGENAAELAMEEAQHVIEKRRRVGSVAGSPDAVPQTVAQLESLVRVAGGSDVLFGAAGEDETDELDATALSAALSRSLGPLNVPFSAAELEEIVIFVANGQPAFRRSDWEEFSAGQVRESAGGNLTPRGPWDGVGSAASSPAAQRTPTASPQSGARAGGLALEKEGAMAAGPAPPAAMLLLHPVEKAMSWAVNTIHSAHSTFDGQKSQKSACAQVVSGWINKQGKSRTRFKRRWCVLVNHTSGHMSLVYYAAEPGGQPPPNAAHHHGRPNGLIPLIPGTFSISEPREKRHSRRKYPWAFQLSSVHGPSQHCGRALCLC